MGTRVHDRPIRMRLQQSQEVLGNLVGVSDREDARARNKFNFCLRQHSRAGQFSTGRLSRVACGDTANLPASANGMPEGGAIEVLAQVH